MNRTPRDLPLTNLARCLLVGYLAAFGLVTPTWASDHADPIDPLRKGRQEGGLTDLFVFPVISRPNPDEPQAPRRDKPAFPFTRTAKLPLHDTFADIVRQPLTAEERSQVDAIVFILCMHRRLDEPDDLRLQPYTFRIHIDAHTAIEFPSENTLTDSVPERLVETAMDAPTAGRPVHEHGKLSLLEAYARYGGRIDHPEEIRSDLTMEFRLGNDIRFQEGYPRYPRGWDSSAIEQTAGVYDDPFIFPTFFGTNVIAIAVRVPVSMLPQDRSEFLVWATSHKGSRQIDHVGRAVRTQNPRFDLLNTLPPARHKAALLREHISPSLARDLALRLNFASLFAYRRWDFVPDVLCFSTKYPVGFPNGRLLTDDVGAILAQHGETLLYELSFQDENYEWPRQMRNDRGKFSDTFPYLREAFRQPQVREPPRLSGRNVAKLWLILFTILFAFAFSHWLFARWYHRRKTRRRYL